MNKKQLIIMWVGIAFFTIRSFDYPSICRIFRREFTIPFTDVYMIPYFMQLFCIILITCAAVYTFKNKNCGGDK